MCLLFAWSFAIVLDRLISVASVWINSALNLAPAKVAGAMVTRDKLSLENQDDTHRVAAIELRDSTRESGYASQAFDFACQVPAGDATEYAARAQRQACASILGDIVPISGYCSKRALQ